MGKDVGLVKTNETEKLLLNLGHKEGRLFGQTYNLTSNAKDKPTDIDIKTKDKLSDIYQNR